MAEVALRMGNLLEERTEFQRFDAINQAVGKVRILKSIRNIHKTVRPPPTWCKTLTPTPYPRCTGVVRAAAHSTRCRVVRLHEFRFGSCTRTLTTWRSSQTMLTPSAVTQARTRTVTCSCRLRALGRSEVRCFTYCTGGGVEQLTCHRH